MFIILQYLHSTSYCLTLRKQLNYFPYCFFLVLVILCTVCRHAVNNDDNDGYFFFFTISVITFTNDVFILT